MKHREQITCEKSCNNSLLLVNLWRRGVIWTGETLATASHLTKTLNKGIDNTFDVFRIWEDDPRDRNAIRFADDDRQFRFSIMAAASTGFVWRCAKRAQRDILN